MSLLLLLLYFVFKKLIFALVQQRLLEFAYMTQKCKFTATNISLLRWGNFVA